MPYAITGAWPPLPPAESSQGVWRIGGSWPPGGSLTFEPRAQTSDEPSSSLSFSAPLVLGTPGASGSGSMLSEEVLALARPCMPSEYTTREYADAHGLEAALCTALNAIAKSRPKVDPMRALAELLPRDGAVGAPTVPSQQGLGDELESMRFRWLTLHGLHMGSL